MKKKILCILQLPPPINGASMANGYLINSKIINQKFNLEVLNLQFNKSVKGAKKFTFLKVFKAIIYSLRIIKKIIKFKPDLVYFTLSPRGFAFYRDAFYILLIKGFKSKIVFHMHGKGIKENIGKNLIKKYIYTIVFKKVNVICLSENLTIDIKEISRAKPYIVPYGIPIYSVSDLNKRVTEIPQILYLSNFTKSKGVLELIEALAKLNKKKYLFSARLVGASDDLTTEMIEKVVNDKCLTKCIKVVGPLYNDEKIQEFFNADIFVLPTFYINEAFPLALLEALQFKLAVISTFEGGIPEMIINNETGILVDGQNIQILANKIAILLDNKVLRNDIGKKGYERFIDNYTLRHFEHKICDVFDVILTTTP